MTDLITILTAEAAAALFAVVYAARDYYRIELRLGVNHPLGWVLRTGFILMLSFIVQQSTENYSLFYLFAVLYTALHLVFIAVLNSLRDLRYYYISPSNWTDAFVIWLGSKIGLSKDGSGAVFFWFGIIALIVFNLQLSITII